MIQNCVSSKKYCHDIGFYSSATNGLVERLTINTNQHRCIFQKSGNENEYKRTDYFCIYSDKFHVLYKLVSDMCQQMS